jgi:lysophospholipase L1-like esterase
VRVTRLRIRIGISAAAPCVALIVLIFPGVSRAGCGGLVTARAHHHVSGQRSPLAIGDSTMLLSLPGLAAEGYDVSAHGCLQFYQALSLLRALRAQGALPHMVTIALGANGTVSRADIDAARRVICCDRLLVLVTPRESGGGAGADAATERQMARAHPSQVLVLDWVKYSQGRGAWFQPDGLHLTFPGVYAFTRLLGHALPYAYAPCPTPASHRRGHVARPLPRRGPLERDRGASRAHARFFEQTRVVGARRGTAGASRTRYVALAAAGLSIRARRAQLGYIEVTVTGQPGAGVQLGEQMQGTTTPIQQVTLPASGTLAVPRLLTWFCTRRSRTVVATTLPPAMPATASSAIETPSCSHRLIAKVAPSARSGRTIGVRLDDRWRIGGLRLTICVAAPGASATCTPWQIRSGRTHRVVQFPAPRPGYWNVTVATAFGQRARATVPVAHPSGQIRLLADGDSEMQILDDFLKQGLGPHRVTVTSDARISTGLTNSFFFNWQAEARRQAHSLHPDVTVMFLGANDGFSVSGPGGKPASCCRAAWSVGYAALAARMMSTLLEGDAGRVYWFLLPAPRPANFRSLFDAVNSGIRQAARRFPARVGLIDANAFFTPHNRYRDYMDYHGHGLVIHESDGVHLSIASDTIAARLVIAHLRADRIIR